MKHLPTTIIVLVLGSALSASAQTLTSLCRAGTPAKFIKDAVYGAPGSAAISPSGGVLFDTALSGPGAPASANRAVFAENGSSSLYITKGVDMGGLLGFLPRSYVTAMSPFLNNRSDNTLFARCTVAGPGLNSGNNQVLLVGFSLPHRTGLPYPSVGGAVLSSYGEAVQRETNPYAITYKLKAGTGSPATNPATDSGLLLVNNLGAVLASGTREGSPAFDGGTFGQFGRVASVGGGYTSFTAKWVSAPDALPVDALFYTGSSSGRSTLVQGGSAGSGAAGEKYGTLTGITATASGLALVRATVTGGLSSTNEGVWMENGNVFLRKGDGVAFGLKVAKIIRVWGINSNQVVAHVTLAGGGGVTAANNQAVILCQSDGAYLFLARSGSQSASTDPGVIASIQAVDVEPINGHYIILASLKGSGTTAANNQTLITGQTTLGDNTVNQALRLPKSRFLKGATYSTLNTPSVITTIKSISIKPAADASGVGARGQAQIINSSGAFVATLTGLAGAQEMVKVTP